MIRSLQTFGAVFATLLALPGAFAQGNDARPVVCGNLADAPRVTCMLRQVDDLVQRQELVVATTVAFDAMELARNIGDADLRYRAHMRTGQLYVSKRDYPNAMRQFVQALKIADTEVDSGWRIEGKGAIGTTFAAMEDYVQAESNLTEALGLAKANKLTSEAARMYAALGDVYLRKGVIGKSQQHLRTAIDLLTQLEEYERAADVSGQLADQYLEAGDYDNAEAYAERTLQLHSGTDDMRAVAADNQRLARVSTAFDDYESSLEFNEIANGIYRRLGDEVGIVETLKDFALTHQELGQRRTARKHADDAMERLRKMTGAEAFEVARDLSLYYERAGDFKMALNAQQDFNRRREAFFGNEKSRALTELKTQYDSQFATEKAQRRIELLEVERDSERLWRGFLLVLVAMAIGLAAVLYRGIRRKKAANDLLQSKNDEIQRQATEIDLKNLEVSEKNDNLNSLNAKLVDEMAERESIQKTSFARDRFLATMSHEMRTPINIISGLCHLLLEENPRPDQVEHLRTLQFSANNLVVFINDILDFSKIEAGKLNLESREFNPRRLFEEIGSRFEMAAKEKDITVTTTFDDAIPACLVGDPARFNQIMTNLVQTSFAHSVKGNVSLSMRVEELTPETTMVRFEIEDDGQVMDDKQLESMFRSFTYNPDDVFEGYNSSDLVLAITRRLVDLQNGQIEVGPRPEGGNRFTVLLTFRIVSDTAARKRVGTPKVFEHLAGNSILLVEDNKINSLVVQKMLTRLGIDVVTALDGVEALEVLANRTFDLVLMDIQMPKMDGYRATAEIRKHINPSVREVPVIALTASAFLSEREKAKLFGMNDHVGKPFAPEELLDKITNCLAVHRGEREVDTGGVVRSSR